MILWSLQQQGFLDKPPFITDGRKSYKWFREPYSWLVKEMEKRIGPPPKRVKYPVWAWHTIHGKRRSPDLRSHYHFEKGIPFHRITLEIPDDKVVLTDFDFWHFPLNKWYLPDVCGDYDCGDTVKIEKSWQYVFDVTESNPCYDANKIPFSERTIQATFWEIKPEYIKKVEFFKNS